MTFGMSLEVGGLVVDGYRTIAVLFNDYKRMNKMAEKFSRKSDGIGYKSNANIKIKKSGQICI